MEILTPVEIEFIKENYNVFDLVLVHGYLPNGYSLIVRELDAISVRLGRKATKLYCGSCIIELFKDLKFIYNNQPAQDVAGKKNKKS